MRKLLKNHRGVSMVEVLITVAILAIVVAPCLAAFVTAQRGNVLAKETAAQYTEASNLMEKLKAAAQGTDEQPLLEILDNYDGTSIHAEYRIKPVEVVPTTEQPEDTEQAEPTVPDSSYIVSQKKTCVEVWIYPGDGATSILGENATPRDDYILSGVITPNIAAESQASDLINELAKLAVAEEDAWNQVIARLASEQDTEPNIYALYQIGVTQIPNGSEGKKDAASIEVRIYTGTDNNKMTNFDDEQRTDHILRAVILPNNTLTNLANDLMTKLTSATTKDAVSDLLKQPGAEEEDKEQLVYVLYREVADETNEPTQIEVWICAGIDQPNRPLADDEIPPENHILHGVIEFDSRNDSIEDPIESQADTQT